jgi:diguanylate cyclase (GGDEF)-like protein
VTEGDEQAIRHRRRHDARVWTLTAVIVVANVVMARRYTALGALAGAPFTIPFWVLAPIYYLSERTVIHFRFHRHAYSFSLSEIPLTIGLFFATPLDLIGGQLLGSAVALLLHRRQRPIKLSFNLAQLALQTVIALTVFRALAGPSPISFSTTLGAAAGAVLAWCAANGLISAAIILSGGSVSREEMKGVLVAGMGAALLNVGLGIVTVDLLWLAPSAAWVGLIPVVVVYISYRAYAAQRLEHGRLTAIYEATRELHGIPQLEHALAAVVQRGCRVFEAEIAEIILTPEGSDGPSFSTRAESSVISAVMERADEPLSDPVTLMALSGTTGYIGSSLRSGDSRVDVIAVPILEQQMVVGVFIVRHPAGDMVEFTNHDLTLLDTMAGQVAVSLENGRLEDSLAAVTELKEELRHQTLHDPLTGLANRTLVQERLEDLLARGAGRAAMVFLDLDDFKMVNDNYGHHAGDELLQAVAARLVRSCRDHDTVARVGGDEFAILLTKLHSDSDVEVVAARILAGLEPPFTVGGSTVFTGASIGITHIVTGDKSDDVLRRADRAMYTAKQARKGSFRVFGESMESEAKRAMRLRQDVQSALVDGGIQLHYQPVVDLATGIAVGAEALIRWNHPEMGPVPPAEILSTADDAGLTDLICAWTIEQACADAARFQRRSPGFSVSVNVDAHQIRAELVDTIRTAVYAAGIEPSTLTIEITETAAIEALPETFAQLAALGIRIALDDFGTGYSSLSRLDTLPIDVVKIDRSFIERMIGPDASPLARMVIEIGHTLDLVTVAEGIETPPQRHHLIELGCKLGQGYLFSPAIPADQLDPLASLIPVR